VNLEHSRPLTQPVSARRDRIVTAIWVTTSVVGVAYAACGIFVGVAQRDIACDYRVELARDRLVSLHEHPASFSEADPSRPSGPEQTQTSWPSGPDQSPRPFRPDEFTNLLRETRAICAGSDPAVLRKLARIEVLYSEFAERQRRHADARQELLAL
jgi:hypothetical protein